MKKSISDLKTADRIEITTIVDNFSDVLLPGNETITRPPLARGEHIQNTTLLAEHGLCLLVKVYTGKQIHSILLDAGYTNVAVPHNLKYLGISLEGLDALILSHGHMDHTGALREILELSGSGTRLVVHPDAFAPRSLQLPSGSRLSFPPFPANETLEQWGADVMENKSPLLLGEGSVLVTGEIPRVTAFEKGMPGALIRHGGEPVRDTFADDQSIVIDLKDKGLVVISGCAHSGIINSVFYARELTGRRNICAVIGGFHLSGQAMAPIVGPTIEALKKMSPQMISPMHCTGFGTISRLAKEMPDAFVLNSVGTRINL